MDIARSQRSVRFIKLHYEEAQMEPAGVPALLAYKGGDKFAGLVPVLDEMRDDDDLSAEALTAALRRYFFSIGVLERANLLGIQYCDRTSSCMVLYRG